MNKLENDGQVNRSYYAIIPANVRYDQSITANAKLLYGEITALANDKGYCWASNNYFAALYKKTPQAISRWIGQLAKAGYVKIDYIKNGKEIKERHIYIDTVSIKSSEGINKKLIGYQYKVKENITHDNIKHNNTSEMFSSFWERYPKKVSKTQAERTFNALIKKGVDPEKIQSCLSAYIKEIEKTGKDIQYIKNPSTFLNNYADYEPVIPSSSQLSSRPKCECGGEYNPGGFCRLCGREIS